MKINKQCESNHTFFQSKDTEGEPVWECWNCGSLEYNLQAEAWK